jgi:hypothetical protein
MIWAFGAEAFEGAAAELPTLRAATSKAALTSDAMRVRRPREP